MSRNKYSDEAEKRVRDFYRKRKRISHPKGKVLIAPASGQKLEQVFYIEKGRVIEYDFNDKGEKVILNVFKEGAFFPMNYILAGTDVKYYFETDSDVMIREASSLEVIQFLETNGVVMFDLMTRVSVGLDGLLKRLSYALSGDVENKIIAELYLSAERFGYSLNEDGTKTLKQDMSVTRISQLIGASREATSRSIGKLLSEKKIKRSGKIYTIS